MYVPRRSSLRDCTCLKQSAKNNCSRIHCPEKPTRGNCFALSSTQRSALCTVGLLRFHVLASFYRPVISYGVLPPRRFRSLNAHRDRSWIERRDGGCACAAEVRNFSFLFRETEQPSVSRTSPPCRSSRQKFRYGNRIGCVYTRRIYITCLFVSPAQSDIPSLGLQSCCNSPLLWEPSALAIDAIYCFYVYVDVCVCVCVCIMRLYADAIHTCTGDKFTREKRIAQRRAERNEIKHAD